MAQVDAIDLPGKPVAIKPVAGTKSGQHSHGTVGASAGFPCTQSQQFWSLQQYRSSSDNHDRHNHYRRQHAETTGAVGAHRVRMLSTSVWGLGSQPLLMAGLAIEPVLLVAPSLDRTRRMRRPGFAASAPKVRFRRPSLGHQPRYEARCDSNDNNQSE